MHKEDIMATKKFIYKDYEDNEETKKAAAAKNAASTQLNNYNLYDRQDYKESDYVSGLRNQLTGLQKPVQQPSQWEQSLNDITNKILNREKFTYDLNGDALYQQYKDMYTTQGKMAMMDTMGQAAAMTGGYGNSYAQTVGQQTYQGHLQQLNDRIPELYKLALDKYNSEGNELYNQYGLLSDREATEYGRHRDDVSDFYNDRSYLTDIYYNESDREYGRFNDAEDRRYQESMDKYGIMSDAYNRADSEYWNNKNFGYGKYSDDKNFSYSDYRNTISDEQRQAEIAEDKRRYDEQMEYQKERDRIADEQWQKEFNAAQAAKNSSSGGGLFKRQAAAALEKANNNTEDEKDSLEDDLNYLIKSGADKSKINTLLREEFKAGNISQAEYQRLKAIYAPAGRTY
jgi:hypothetical protein